MEKSKAPLSLMEQVLMILVFALAMSVVLRVFVYCGLESKGLERENRALGAAMSVCEAIRAGDDTMLDGVRLGSDFDVRIDGCDVSVRYRDDSIYFWTAEVTATSGNRSVTLRTAGQKEVSP